MRCTRPLQAAQVMPVTGMVQDSGRCGVSVCVMAGRSCSAMIVPRTMPMPQVNSWVPGERGEGHRRRAVGRQVGADPEVGNHDFLGAGIGLVAVEVEPDRSAGPHANDGRRVPALHLDADPLQRPALERGRARR